MNSRWLPLGLFLGLFLLLMRGGQSSFLRDPGTFWHVRCGDLMLQEQQLIQKDSFSFTREGRVWQPHGWLGEILMALLHRVGGFDALLLATGVLLAGLYSWLTSRYLSIGLNPVFVFSWLGLILAASASHFHARPHLLTLLYLTILAHQLLQAESGKISRLWWMMPLLVLWANTHGGVLAGILTMGVTLIGWFVAFAIGFPSPIRGVRDLIEVVSLGFATLLTLFVNPFGSSLVLTILDLARMPELPRIIEEHAPLDLLAPTSWPYLLCGAVYLFLLAGLREKPRSTWLLPLVWFALGISRVRHGSLACVLMLLILVDLFPRTTWAKWLQEHRPDFYDAKAAHQMFGCWIGLAALLTLGAGLILQAAYISAPLIGRGAATLNPKYVPLDLLPVMRAESRSSGVRPRLFNELNYGGFAIYYVPEYRVFIDDRCELYGGEWLERYTQAETRQTAEYLAEMQQTFGTFDYALTIRESGFDRYFLASPEWEQLDTSEHAAFYKRRR